MTTVKRTIGEVFETVTCPRCGGEKILWQHSNVMGGTCFKCSGTGRTFTARGSRDLAAYREAVKIATMHPASEVKIGDAVRSRNMKSFVPVVAISEPSLSSWTAKPGKPGNITSPTANPEWWNEHFSIEIKLNHAVWHDLGCPLSYKGDTFSVELEGEIGIYPGLENMPIIDTFDSRK